MKNKKVIMLETFSKSIVVTRYVKFIAFFFIYLPKMGLKSIKDNTKWEIMGQVQLGTLTNRQIAGVSENYQELWQNFKG